MTAAPQLDMTTLLPSVSAAEGRLMMALKFTELGRLSLGKRQRWRVTRNGPLSRC